MNKISINMYLSIITLNINGLNAPIERHRVAEWIPKKILYIYTPYSIRKQQDTEMCSKGFCPWQWVCVCFLIRTGRGVVGNGVGWSHIGWRMGGGGGLGDGVRRRESAGLKEGLGFYSKGMRSHWSIYAGGDMIRFICK